MDEANIVNDQDPTRDQYAQILFNVAQHGGPSFLNGTQISTYRGSAAASSSVFGGDIGQYTPLTTEEDANILIAPSFLSRDIPLSGLQTVLGFLGLPPNTTPPGIAHGTSPVNYTRTPELPQNKMSHLRRLV